VLKVIVEGDDEDRLTASQLNTFGIVVSHLSQFFFNMILNGIFLGVGIYRNTNFRSLLKRKYPVKVLWTLATSLTITSFAIIYDEDWSFPAKDFFALWATEWYVQLSAPTRGDKADAREQGIRLDQLQHCWRRSCLPPAPICAHVHFSMDRDFQCVGHRRHPAVMCTHRYSHGRSHPHRAFQCILPHLLRLSKPW
jgi:hypothetical protein